MLNYQDIVIEKLSAHFVGNKLNGEALRHSKSLLGFSDDRVKAALIKYFLSPFNYPEFYAFSADNDNREQNALYNFTAQIFDNPKSFSRQANNIAKQLYEISDQPEIKAGDLFVVYFSNIYLDDETTDAVGIFKTENKYPFLKLENESEDFVVSFDEGINIEKPDKACLILNSNKDSGFKVCFIDKSVKSNEIQYWRDLFLKVKPFKDDYHSTKDFMFITKNFITDQLADDFEFSRADQIDLLNRSVEYFKKNDTFEKKHFEKEVFQDDGVIKSFRKFDESFRDQHQIDVSDNFDISPYAVKKQSKVFKSILKLDKNFHIYIHGNRELIEQGTDADGRKFYKIYFKEEH